MRAIHRIQTAPSLLLLAAAAISHDLGTQTTTTDVGRPGRNEAGLRWLPFAFHTETFETGFGAGAAYRKDQWLVVGGGFITTNDSWGALITIRDIHLGSRSRVFLTSLAGYGRIPALRAYVDGNPDFPNEDAGSNDSSPDNFLEDDGHDGVVRASFRWVLPIGDRIEDPILHYDVENGFVTSESASGGRGWRPWRHGSTFLDAELFFESRNHDFQEAPENISRDFGRLDGNGPWTMAEIELAKYFDLGSSRLVRQSVFALDLWTADIRTWEETRVDGRRVISGAPPYYAGVYLGGLHRMRGYTHARFNDRSAVYYAAELRVIPTWNPLPEIRWLDPFAIDWWQSVAFAEVARVHNEWDLAELHSDMKLSGGVGLRLMLLGTIGRLDLAFSSEEWALKVMAGHTF